MLHNSCVHVNELTEKNSTYTLERFSFQLFLIPDFELGYLAENFVAFP